MDNYKTDVTFRVDITKDWKDTVYAIFPHDCADHKGNVTGYLWVGQHTAMDYSHCLRTSRPATLVEYADLAKHLKEHFGYNLNIIKKQNRNKFLKSYRSV